MVSAQSSYFMQVSGHVTYKIALHPVILCFISTLKYISRNAGYLFDVEIFTQPVSYW